MKAIIYFLITVFMVGIVVSAIPKPNLKPTQLIQIQCVDARASSKLLNESCSIIKNRLNDYGLQNFEITVDSIQKSIQLTFRDKVDEGEIVPLLTAKGKTEFYETYDRIVVIELLKKDDGLFSILNIPFLDSETDLSSAIFGYCKLQNKLQVDEYIAKHYVSKRNEGVRFVWGEKPNSDNDYFLYVLKHKAALDKSGILQAAVQQDKQADIAELLIEFNDSGKTVWKNLTKSNIGKPIAIVIDNEVCCVPVVMTEIESGKCTISGNFSIQELMRLKLLVNNGDLPLEFEVKE